MADKSKESARYSFTRSQRKHVEVKVTWLSTPRHSHHPMRVTAAPSASRPFVGTTLLLCLLALFCPVNASAQGIELPAGANTFSAANELPYRLSEPSGPNVEPVQTTQQPVDTVYPAVATSERPRILFQPAVPYSDPGIGTILRPTVHLDGEPVIDVPPSPTFVEELPVPIDAGLDRVPVVESIQPDPIWVPPTHPGGALRNRKHKPLLSLYRMIQNEMRAQKMRDVGVGVERLPFALFEMDASQPANSFRIRYESAFDWELADRAEFLWSKLGGKGPELSNPLDFENSVDYQEMRLFMEVGGKKFSVTTEIPLRFINPTLVGNTGGMGDMVITTKTVMLDGDALQITQVLRNQLATGAPKKGLGNGHTSMEPGFIARLKWSERTMIHNELKLWFPLGGDPEFSGNVLRYGCGVANVLYDSDTFAVLPTLEFVGWSILGGQQSIGVLGPETLDGVNLFNIYPGVRIVSDGDGDLGMFEVGVGGGVAVTERHWYQSVIRLDMRWTF